MEQRSCLANYFKIILGVIFCTVRVVNHVLSYGRITFKARLLFRPAGWLLFLAKNVLTDNSTHV